MSEKVKILDVEIDKCSKKVALNKLISFVESDAISIVDVINMDMLNKGQEMPELREAVKVFDLVLPGDEAVAQAIELEEESPLADFFQYMHKHKKKVFVVAQTKESLASSLDAIKEQQKGILIVGSAVLPTEIESEEALINQINGAAPDCVLAVLPAPLQEAFIIRNYATVNARLWLGCENMMDKEQIEKSFGKVKHFLKWKWFQRKVEKEKQL